MLWIFFLKFLHIRKFGEHIHKGPFFFRSPTRIKIMKCLKFVSGGAGKKSLSLSPPLLKVKVASLYFLRSHNVLLTTLVGMKRYSFKRVKLKFCVKWELLTGTGWESKVYLSFRHRVLFYVYFLWWRDLMLCKMLYFIDCDIKVCDLSSPSSSSSVIIT